MGTGYTSVCGVRVTGKWLLSVGGNGFPNNSYTSSRFHFRLGDCLKVKVSGYKKKKQQKKNRKNKVIKLQKYVCCIAYSSLNRYICNS